MFCVTVQKLSLGILFLGICSAGLIPDFGKKSEDIILPLLSRLSPIEKISEIENLGQQFFSQRLSVLEKFTGLFSHSISAFLEIIFDDISNIANKEDCPKVETKLVDLKEVIKEIQNMDESSDYKHHATILEMTELLETRIRKVEDFCPQLITLLNMVLESTRNLKEKNEILKEDSEEKVEDRSEPDAVAEE